MNTLYIRLPSKTAADKASRWLSLACPFALTQGNTIGQQGIIPLSDMSDMIARAQRVVALVAASDVTLWRTQVPPLSPAKLKAALPNLVEDRLIGDPSECAVIAGPLADGLRTIAVVQRVWLAIIAKALQTLGARNVTILPSQLCLPCPPVAAAQVASVKKTERTVQNRRRLSSQPASLTAAISEHENNIEMTLRLSEQEGMGLTISTDQNEMPAHEVLQTLDALAPQASVVLYVPQAAVRIYQDAINHPDAINKRINVLADNWTHWIAGAQNTTLDLMASLKAEAGNGPQWRAWRWPLALTAAILLINVTALNVGWWRMQSEATALRASMTQIYKSTFPKESVIIDPIAQMRQKIAASKHDAGIPAADDFISLSAAFGKAWSNIIVASGPSTQLRTGKAFAIAAIEYHDRNLIVRLKPGPASGPGSEVPMQQMKTVLAERNLALELAPSDSAAVVWKIRSTK